VCAVAVVDAHVHQARGVARSWLLPRQRRWHFAEESDRRRRQILDDIVGCSLVRGLVISGKGDDDRVRDRCLSSLVGPLLDVGVRRLIIESRQVRDQADRRTLARELRGRRQPFTYDHLRPVEDEGLWLADALAWTFSAGGAWRRRIEPIVTFHRDLGPL
jgi:hypothetical protein